MVALALVFPPTTDVRIIAWLAFCFWLVAGSLLAGQSNAAQRHLSHVARTKKRITHTKAAAHQAAARTKTVARTKASKRARAATHAKASKRAKAVAHTKATKLAKKTKSSTRTKAATRAKASTHAKKATRIRTVFRTKTAAHVKAAAHTKATVRAKKITHHKAVTHAKAATRAKSSTRTKVAKPTYHAPANASRYRAAGSLHTPGRYRLRTVVLDAGHGGKDIGCNGADAHEADVALAIIRALGRQIEDNMPDVRVIYTRKTDVFVELDERAAIANRNHADLFISVHCNAGPRGSHGTEVWTMGLHKTDANLGVAQRENSVILQEKDYQRRYDGFDPRSPQSHILFSLFQSAYITNSLRFAQRIDRQFRTNVGRSSRGVKQAGFLVLWKSTMPSVLVEAGFLTDPTEENYLDDKAGQQAIAGGIYRAFRDYKHDLEGGPAE